jgi:hypothetical protein
VESKNDGERHKKGLTFYWNHSRIGKICVLCRIKEHDPQSIASLI